MSEYLPAIVVAAAALFALALLAARAVGRARRLGNLARAYQRQLAAESALLAHRTGSVRSELARHARRTHRRTPRTMR